MTPPTPSPADPLIPDRHGAVSEHVRRLETDAEIDAVIHGTHPELVVGLSQRGDVMVQLPKGNDYATFSPDQAEALAGLIRKWAAESRRKEKA